MTGWFSNARHTRQFLPGVLPGLAVCLFVTLLIVWMASANTPGGPEAVKYDVEASRVLAANLPPAAEGRRLSNELTVSERLAAIRENLRRFSATGNARHLRYAEAIAESSRAVPGNSPELSLLTARIQQSLHQFDRAADTLRALLADQPQSAEAWLLLTDSLRRAGRIDEARKGCVSLALSGEPRLAQWCAIQILQSAGDTERAYTLAVRELRAFDDRQGDLYRWALEITAEAAAMAGDSEQAVSLYREALRTGSDSFGTRLALADVLLANRKADAVVELLEEHRENVSALIRISHAQKIAARRADAEVLERIRSSFAGMAPSRTDDPRLRDRAMFELHVNERADLALDYAIANWSQQKGPEDLALLRAAAERARDASALAIVEDWRRQAGGASRT